MATIDDITVEFKANTRNLDRGIDRSERGLKGMAGTARLAVAAVAAIGGSQVIRQLGRTIESGGRIENTFQGAAKAFGNADAALSTLRKGTKGLIADYDVLVAANRAVTLGAVENSAEFSRLASGAIALGKAQGLDAASAVDSLTLGLARQSRELLDNIGITVRAEEAQKKYAEANNLAVSALSEAQRQEAFRLEVVAKLNDAVENLGVSTENNADKLARMLNTVTSIADEFARISANSQGIGGFLDAQNLGLGAIRDALQQRRLGLSQEGFGRFQSNSNLSTVGQVQAARGNLVNDLLGGEFDSVDFPILLKQLADMERALSGSADGGVPKSLEDLRARLADVSKGLEIATPKIEGLGLAADVVATDPGRPGAPNLTRVQALRQLRASDGPLAGVGVPGFTIGTGGEDAGFFSRILGNADPARIFENAIGGLLTGGVTSLVGQFTSAIGGLFGGGGPSQLELALESNREAIERNTQAVLGGVAGGIVGSELSSGLDTLGLFRSGGGTFADYGNNIEQIRDLADQFDITLGNVFSWRTQLEQLIEAVDAALIKSFQEFGGAFDLFQREIGLLDLDPDEQFAGIGDLLDQIGANDGLQGFFDSLSAENIDAEIARIFGQIRSGNVGEILALLGDDLSLQEFIELLTFAEGALDGLGETADDVSRALRNVPSGFKVALAEFRATQVGGGGRGGNGRDPFVGGPGGGGGVDPGIPMMNGNITVNISAQGADAQEVYEVFEKELARRGRLGGRTRFQAAYS